MGMLFENMEKMDIQEERRKTAEQRKRAEAAERRVEEAEKRMKEAMKKLEDSIRFFVESCQNEGLAQEDTITKLVKIYQMSSEIAGEKMIQYWK